MPDVVALGATVAATRWRQGFQLLQFGRQCRCPPDGLTCNAAVGATTDEGAVAWHQGLQLAWKVLGNGGSTERTGNVALNVARSIGAWRRQLGMAEGLKLNMVTWIEDLLFWLAIAAIACLL